MNRSWIRVCLLLAALAVIWCPAPDPAAAQDRFTDNGNGTITDHQLGVMWAQDDNQGDVTWKEAQRYCQVGPPHLIGKYNDWRLPTLAELESLYRRDPGYGGYETDCGQQVKMVEAIRLSCGWVWSSEKRSITARVYNFNRGYSYTDRMSAMRHYRALPIRDLNN